MTESMKLGRMRVVLRVLAVCFVALASSGIATASATADLLPRRERPAATYCDFEQHYTNPDCIDEFRESYNAGVDAANTVGDSHPRPAIDAAVNAVDAQEQAAGYPTTIVTDQIPLNEGDTVLGTPAGTLVVSDEGDASAYSPVGSPLGPVGTSTLSNLAAIGDPVDAQTVALVGTALVLLPAVRINLITCGLALVRFGAENFTVFAKIKKLGGVYKVAKKILKVKETKERVKLIYELFDSFTGVEGVVQGCT